MTEKQQHSDKYWTALKELRVDPLNDDKWRTWVAVVDDEIATSTPPYFTRRGDYIWMPGNELNSDPPVLLLDYWHYDPPLPREGREA